MKIQKVVDILIIVKQITPNQIVKLSLKIMIILSVELSLKSKGQENLLSNLKEVKTPNIELEKVIDNSQHSTSLIILFSFNIKIY